MGRCFGQKRTGAEGHCATCEQERWGRSCSQVGVTCTLHQLRHSHATELINGGVSLPTIRKRLGHKNLQTTLRYAEQADTRADAEVQAWRRQQHQHPS